MKNLFLIITIIFVSIVACSQFTKRTKLGIDDAKNELHQALTDTVQKQILVDTVIKDKQTAISVSEAILFKIYGKDKIISERPYEIYFIDGFWILEGTLPDNMVGGTFLIIIKAKDGQVIKLTHGK
jgi:hypothetical protein